MTEHPITPPPELVAKLWREASEGRDDAPIGEIFNHGIYLAYAAGADQELEACCEWLSDTAYRQSLHLNGSHLRAARRPKPPSLKEQALKAIGVPTKFGEARVIEHREHELVRRALEALDD
jgi:hypothetical protein